MSDDDKVDKALGIGKLGLYAIISICFFVWFKDTKYMEITFGELIVGFWICVAIWAGIVGVIIVVVIIVALVIES